MALAEGWKRCSACHEPKPESEFFRNKNTIDGRCYQCKDCMRIQRTQPEAAAKRRDYYRCKHYGLQPGQFDELAAAVGNACEICGSTEKLVLDHVKGTHTVRGILCGRCNTAIGMLRHSAPLLEAVLDYIRTHPN